jgi:hypothetical protein
MRSLDLFCGTKSFSKIAENHGYETHTLDILEKFNPSICCDIMQWDYKEFPPGYFHIIWSSPNCKDYSKMNFICNKMDKDLTESNNLIQRVLDIIDYFQPTYWFLENPQTGKLKDQIFMQDLPYNDIDYCKYDYTYRKRTRIWNNSPFVGLPLCKKNQYCNHIVDGKHTGWNCTAWDGSKRKILKWEDRISIPPKLMEAVIKACAAPQNT